VVPESCRFQKRETVEASDSPSLLKEGWGLNFFYLYINIAAKIIDYGNQL
jgi:hypothetical protein